MKEKLQEYALIAEIVSALCIVLSLIFVGLQVQQGAEETAQNSRVLQATVRESMMAADLAVLRYIGDHAYDMAPEGVPNPIPPQFDRVAWGLEMIFRTRENYWLQHSQGLLDDDTYLSYRGSMLAMLNNVPVAKQRRASAQPSLVKGFVDEINAALARPQAAPAQSPK